MSFNFQQGQGQGGGFNLGMLQPFLSAFQQGNNFDHISHDDVYNSYQQAAQQIPPQQLQQAHQQYYQQMPQQQRQGMLSGLLGALGNLGIGPQQIGMNGTDPTPQNLAAANQFVAQRPDLMQQIFGPGGLMSNPMAKAALAGGLAFAAQHFFGNQNQGQPNQNFGNQGQPNQNFGNQNQSW